MVFPVNLNVEMNLISLLENPAWDGSPSLDWSAWDVDSKLANKLHERWKRYTNGDVCKYVLAFPFPVSCRGRRHRGVFLDVAILKLWLLVL